MMKIFYNILLIFCVISFAGYGDDVLQITKRTKTEVWTAIDQTANRVDYKKYELYKVYQIKTELDGKPIYKGFIDSIYIKEILSDKIIFNYVWQEEWRNIEEGYYVVSSGMTYAVNDEKIRNIFTTETIEEEPAKKETSGSSVKSSRRHPLFMILSGGGIQFGHDISDTRGFLLESDLILTIYHLIGIRFFFSFDSIYADYDIGFYLEFVYKLKQLRIYAFCGGYPYHPTNDKIADFGVGGGWFFSLFSSAGKEDTYLDIQIKAAYTSSGIEENLNGYTVLNIKFGFCFF